MTRIAWAEWSPGPKDRRGYGGVKALPLERKEGEVKHSTEGSLAAALGVFTDPSRQASWHFTLPKQGPVRAYQHYELEDITWHCGLPGDERHDTSLIGNITLIGEEHEGWAGEPLTPWQVENSIQLSQDIRAVCPAIGVPALRVNLWEHGWLSNTACPSGRIPWDTIIAELQEDTMALTDADIAKIVAAVGADTSERVIGILRSPEFDLDRVNNDVKELKTKLDAHAASGAHTHDI